MQLSQNTSDQPAAPLPARPHGYWEQPSQLQPAAPVLDDLQSFPGDAESARWIIVRYAAMQAVAGLLDPTVDAQVMRVERGVALNHVAALPMLDREAWSLKHALESLSQPPVRATVTALIQAGAGAEQRTHVRGAFAIYHMVYVLARRHAWFEEAAQAARGIERLARDGGAIYAPRLWRRRARVMEKRSAAA